MDYYNEFKTETIARADLLKVLILNKWNFVIDAFEAYDKVESVGGVPQTSTINARMLALYNSLYGMLTRDLKTKELEQLFKDCKSNHIDEVRNAYWQLTVFMDKKGITKIDTKKTYDTTDIEEENSQDE